MLLFQASVIGVPDTFILHTPDTHSDPPIQHVELVQVAGKSGVEIVHRTSDHPIYSFDRLCIKVVAATSKSPDFHLKAFLGFQAHLNGA